MSAHLPLDLPTGTDGKIVNQHLLTAGQFRVWSSTGSKTTRRRTSLCRTVVWVASFRALADGRFSAGFVTGRQELWTTLTFTSRTMPLASGLTLTTRPSLNWPLTAFWSHNQTISPTATLRCEVCHLLLRNKFGPASWLQDLQNLLTWFCISCKGSLQSQMF